ncbi:MAG: GNAT family N-acetyltransferase, partial [Candidatus Ornithospirochaeta sp.]
NELGYVVDPAYKGRGFATEAVEATICELREMGFRKVIAGYFEGNVGSLKVMEKCGMHPNGKSNVEEYRGKTLKCYECEMELQ